MEVLDAVQASVRSGVFGFFDGESVVDPADGWGGEGDGCTVLLWWGHGAFCECVVDAFQQGGLSWTGPVDLLEIQLNAAFAGRRIVAIGAMRRQQFAQFRGDGVRATRACAE